MKVPPSKNTLLKDLTFCALDLETTGVNPAFDRIIEIGMITFSLNSVYASFETLVNPHFPIPHQAQKIHGISDSMVKDSPLITAVKDDFLSFINDAVFVIQNPGFDLSFIEMFVNADSPGQNHVLRSIDTVTLARKTWPHFHNHKLGTLSANLGIEHNYHRALSDAEVCMKVFLAVLKEKNALNWTWRDFLNFHGDLFSPRLSRKREGILFRGVSRDEDVTIKYHDSDGRKTVRRITPRELIRYGKKSYVLAYCHLRQRVRYFATERITRVVSKE